MDIAKSEIRAYISQYGPFHIFLTLNPPAQHSPVFHVICGDTKVDLTVRDPQLPSNSDRARRLASDPVSAADYFDFHIRSIFGHLLGWNFHTRTSTAEGGLFGRLKCFFLSRELTDRGNLHGHSIIWLEDALTPSNIRTLMDSDDTFQAEYFEWAEDLAWHHLPPHADEAIDDRLEPRQQRPPHPSDPFFEAQFDRDHIILGTKYQLHTHRNVCYKTAKGPPRTNCRFRFPHQQRTQSEYDAESQSILLKVLHPWVNWHNPYLLVATRHNHDVQIVQSGRSAEAAARYIVDYVLKHDLTVPKGLRALADVLKRVHDKNELPEFKRLLRLVISQIMRISNVHAQKAALYLRGETDTFQSHSTKPLVMPNAISYLRKQYKINDINAPTATEMNPVTLQNADQHHITASEQYADYIYRHSSAHHLNLWDFIKQTEVLPKQRAPKPSSERNINVYTLLPPHSKSNTHVIVHRPCSTKLTRIVGSKIPRANSKDDEAFLFYLAAFKPHATTLPLLSPGQTVREAWETFDVSPATTIILQNWKEMELCDDAYDADILRQRSDEAAELTAHQRTTSNSLNNDEDDAVSLDEDINFNISPTLTNEGLVIEFLSASAWTTDTANKFQGSRTSEALRFPITDRLLRSWQEEIKTITVQHSNQHVADSAPSAQSSVTIGPDARTIPFSKKTIVENLLKSHALSSSQAAAFRLVAHATLFPTNRPLRLLLLGEAGTGKTKIITILQHLLAMLGESDAIQVTAPTGKAASLVSGVTQHKAFQLPIFQSGKKEDNTKAFMTSAGRLQTLRTTYKNLRFLFCDEASMTSLQQLHTIDNSCRTAREDEHKHEWFGGMNAIMAGDLFQLPPVTGSPLYQTPKLDRTHDDNARIAGRAAFQSFESAIVFTEQFRIREPHTSALFNRIRTRTVTQQDVETLNSRILADHLQDPKLSNATVLVKTNSLRRSLADIKTRASATAEAPLIECHAIDSFSIPATKHLRDTAIRFEARHPPSSWIPGNVLVHDGMRVVYRGKNRSVPHGITNGATGTVKNISTFTDEYGHTCPSAIFVHMDSGTFQLTDLPARWYPFLPETCSFKIAYIDQSGTPTSVTVKRKQMKLQPASVMTVHTAQGTTITDGVICDARHGGFLTYVAISRTTSLENLFLIAPVTVNDVNSIGIPPDLAQEMNRLSNIDLITRERISALSWTEHQAQHETQAQPQPRLQNIENTTTSQNDPISRSATSDDMEMHSFNESKEGRTQIRHFTQTLWRTTFVAQT
ncbi:hypothetical protein CF319_g7661 [Tilletia indica]|uniref:ATP-dependent DNA helicase n=1 Tax=Tilletia indica TaxID=43049 RepID=A0A177TMZ1_9BASI|nr:hypothetical protein CF319_g7661 [Tilletia indica]KAE8244015.1 hypothetical protein A4X13_0g6853 [Tilletia indica]